MVSCMQSGEYSVMIEVVSYVMNGVVGVVMSGVVSGIMI